MQLLHPFMPFITEEIWHLLQDNYNIDDTIMLTPWPTADSYDENIINDINFIFEFISTVRSLKAQYNITKEDIEVYYNDTEYDKVIKDYEELILKMAQVKSINKNKQLKNTAEALVRTITISIPITETNIEEEKEKILKELDYYKGFLANVNKKLKNENFLKKAPDKVIENEKKKQQDTIKKIESLKKLLKKYEN